MNKMSKTLLVPITNADLPTLEALMARYADRPMDFADATLVHVAEREGLRTILTIDHRISRPIALDAAPSSGYYPHTESETAARRETREPRGSSGSLGT